MKRRKPLRRVSPLWAKAKAAGLRRSKGKANYKNRLWEIFSEYIRRKNADHAGNVACVTCGKVDHWKRQHAGHYHARTTGLALYFDEKNVHVQCVGCNHFGSGNLAQYALFLQRAYGVGILEELDAKRREFRKITEAEYIDMIADYRERLKNLPLPGLPEAA